MTNPVVHFEMPYDDRARMAAFYANTFGWNNILLGEDMGNYVVTHTAPTVNGMPQTSGTINGGFYPRKPDWPAQHPSVVIAVEDIAAAIAKVKQGGGEVLGEPMLIPGIGQYVSFMDTEGNRVSMLQALPRG